MQTLAVNHAIAELHNIAHLMNLYESELPVKTPAPWLPEQNQSIYENDTMTVLHLDAPKHVEFYQPFEIKITLQNTGHWTWEHRIITAETLPQGPQIELTEIPVTKPGATCQLSIPAYAQGFEGDFITNLNIYVCRETDRSTKVYAKPIEIQTHVGFAPGLFD